MEEIIENVRKNSNKDTTLLIQNMSQNSFFSMKLNYFYYLYSKFLELKSIYQIDFRIIHNIMKLEEFFIGVKSLLIDRSKEPTKWQFSSFEEVPRDLHRFLEEYDKENDQRLDSKIFD